MTAATVLGIIIPCYNEEEVIVSSMEKLLGVLRGYIEKGIVSERSFIGIVDDRSRDRTWEIIRQFSVNNKNIRAIRLSSNRGHQYALLAGLTYYCADADCLVSIDADLQDDVGVMAEMIGKFNQGNDIIYGVRKNRPGDSPFKKMTALAFYRFLRAFGAEVVYNQPITG
jgi:glycosyltransferase involved in cell wall biosynthesis